MSNIGISNPLIKVKVVNLERRFDRLKSFIIEMHKHDINEYERFNAVDGQTLVMDDNIKKIFERNRFNWRKGIIGCALSHYHIWKELVNSEYTYFFVLEDDVILCDNFSRLYRNILRMMRYCEYPFIYLGYSTQPSKDKEVEIGGNEIFISTLKNKKKMWGGTFAYIIHKKMAKNFVDEIERRGIRDPIDVFILRHQGLHETVPQIIKSPLMTSTSNADSDIQYDLLNVFDNYVFFSELDSPANDIEFVGKKKLKTLKELADKNNNCVAFNSLGFLKHDICSPKDFIKITTKGTKKEGLYLKIKKYEKYDFYPQLDSPGNDLRCLGKMAPEELQKIADVDQRCVAFNTNGCFKHTITDLKNFVKLENCKSVNEGIYVKKNVIV